MTREDRQICTIVLSCYSMNKEFLAHIQQSHAYKILKAILISPCILIKYGEKKKHNLKCLIVVIKGNFHFHKKKNNSKSHQLELNCGFVTFFS